MATAGGTGLTTIAAVRSSTTPRPTAATTEHYQPVRLPIVLIDPTSSGPPDFQVRVRMNRRLPVDRQGVRANLLVGKASSDDSPAPFGRRSRHCYVGEIGSPGVDSTLKDVHPGSIVRVSIRVAGQRSIVRSVPLKSLRARSSVSAVKALGCGKL
jgi:hypothetical protein